MKESFIDPIALLKTNYSSQIFHIAPISFSKAFKLSSSRRQPKHQRQDIIISNLHQNPCR